MEFGLDKAHVAAGFALSLAFAVQGAAAADWYATDVRQQGHDPTVIRNEDGYVLMSTNNMLLMWSSEDAVTWKQSGQVLSAVPSWMNSAVGSTVENLWAPDIFKVGDNYGVFYTGSAFGKNTSAIGLATNSTLSGSGWTDKGEIVRSTTGNDYNAIDADVIKTSSGEYWMAFGSWWQGIRLVQLDPTTGLQNQSNKTVYKIANRGGSGIEGPSLIEHDGKYFLFTAWDVCCKQGDDIEQTTYKTAMGRADNVTGPYVDRSGKSLVDGGGTILMERYSRYIGPGGGEPFQDLNRIRFVHHYYDLTGDKYNHIHIRDVVFTDDNWAEMGQPFLGRYLSAEAEHGAMTRSVTGDLTFSYTDDASNGEYVGYINTSGSKIRLPMNIMQAGEYLVRYRYANGGDEDATHKVSVNGVSQSVKLPKTGAWGAFPESSVAYFPVTFKRGGNFIEIEPETAFAELDRLDFLRIIRDSIPGNGFDNGIKIRLNENDALAMKDGGYALFENVVTDSIVSTDVRMQFKGATSGKISIRTGSKTGTVVSECDLSKGVAGSSGWSEVTCSELGAGKKLTGVQDFFLTASGISGEVAVGNVLFKAAVVESSSSVAEESSNSVTEESSSDVASSSDIAESSSATAIEDSSSSTTSIAKMPVALQGFAVTKTGNGYAIHFDHAMDGNLYVFNSMGQAIRNENIRMRMDIQIDNLPKGNYVFRVVKR